MVSDNTKTFIEEHFDGGEKENAVQRAEKLLSRGLTDENLVVEILKKETPLPKRLPAEMYDKVNYMCRRWMDRMVHFEVEYGLIPDVAALKNVIICMLESAPVFHSCFVDNKIRPYWKVSDYHIDDVFSVKETDNLTASAERFLLQKIEVKSNVQIKFCLFTCNGKCRLAVVFNHMCMDARGLKAFLKDLFGNYNEYVQKGTVSLFHSNKSRSYERVYDDFTKEDRKKAKRLFANVSVKDNHSLPFSEPLETDIEMIVRKEIDNGVLESVRKKARGYGATVNDILSAAYIRAFYEMSDCGTDESVGIACAVDLRRYMNSLENIGYTNHMSYMPCVVESLGENMSDTLQAVVGSTKQMKNDKFLGLHGLPLLNLGYSTMVYVQAECIVRAFYNNANLAISNVGELEPYMFAVGDAVPTSVSIAGAVKEKPCAMMTAVSYNGKLTLSVCVRGNEKDRQMLEDFLDGIEENIKRI